MVVAVAACTVGSLTGTASAHGGHGGAPEAFPVVCEDVEYLVTTGDGNWAAAVTSDRTTRFIPSAFDLTFEVRDAAGNLVESESGSFSDSKGGGHAHQKQAKTTCTFSESGTEADGSTWVFSGVATVVKR